LADIAGDLLVVEAGLAHAPAIELDAFGGRRVALRIEQDRPSVAAVADDRLLARGRAVELGMRPGIGARPQHGNAQVPEPAAMLDLLAGPRLADDLLGLLEARLRLLGVEPEALVLVDVVEGATVEADDEASFAEVVEQRKLLGEAHRMMQRGLDD